MGCRRALMMLKGVPLRTRRALTLHTLYCDSTLLVLNGLSLISINTLLALKWRYIVSWEPEGRYCRTRRVLLPLTLYSNSTLLALNGTSLSCNNALLALNWQYVHQVLIIQFNAHTSMCWEKDKTILRMLTKKKTNFIPLFIFINNERNMMGLQ